MKKTSCTPLYQVVVKFPAIGKGGDVCLEGCILAGTFAKLPLVGSN